MHLRATKLGPVARPRGGADESVCLNAAVRLHEGESRNARHLEVSRMYLELAEDEDVAVKPRSRARSGPEL